MKTHIWNCASAFPNKVNFVDSNNVVLGYDLLQNCCEDAFWTVGVNKDGTGDKLKCDDDNPLEIEFDHYTFDPEFYEDDPDDSEDHVAIFKLVYNDHWENGRFFDSKEFPDLYVRLENHHNGYYSHGFIFRADKTIKGDL